MKGLFVFVTMKINGLIKRYFVITTYYPYFIVGITKLQKRDKLGISFHAHHASSSILILTLSHEKGRVEPVMTTDSTGCFTSKTHDAHISLLSELHCVKNKSSRGITYKHTWGRVCT